MQARLSPYTQILMGQGRGQPLWSPGLGTLKALPYLSKLICAKCHKVVPQPLEDKTVSMGRSVGSPNCPASFTLITVMSPSPCGYFNDPGKECTCSTPVSRSGAARVDMRTHRQKSVSGSLESSRA